MRGTPLNDLAARVLEHVRAVKHVAYSASNLSGSYKHLLNKAAYTMEAAVLEIACSGRLTPGEAQEIQEENRRLREQVADLRAEVETLRGEIQASHSGKCPTPSSSPTYHLRHRHTPPRVEAPMIPISQRADDLLSSWEISERRPSLQDGRVNEGTSRAEDNALIEHIAALFEGKLGDLRKEIQQLKDRQRDTSPPLDLREGTNRQRRGGRRRITLSLPPPLI